MLSIEEVTFNQRESVLFDRVSLVLKSGDVVRIDGSNGTGKTTLLKIITGMIIPDSGKVTWNNKSIYKLKEDYYSNIIYLGHKLALKYDLTVSENLQFYYSLKRSDKKYLILKPILDKLNLTDYSHSLVKILSEGQKRRIALARLWFSSAQLWILDEPFTAIDKDLKSKLNELFDNHINNGGMILYTSHNETIKNSILFRVDNDPMAQEVMETE